MFILSCGGERGARSFSFFDLGGKLTALGARVGVGLDQRSPGVSGSHFGSVMVGGLGEALELPGVDDRKGVKDLAAGRRLDDREEP